MIQNFVEVPLEAHVVSRAGCSKAKYIVKYDSNLHVVMTSLNSLGLGQFSLSYFGLFTFNTFLLGSCKHNSSRAIGLIVAVDSSLGLLSWRSVFSWTSGVVLH